MFLPLYRAFYNFNIFSSMKLFIIFIFQIYYHLKFSIWLRMKYYQLLLHILNLWKCIILSKVTYLEKNVKKDNIVPCRNFTEK